MHLLPQVDDTDLGSSGFCLGKSLFLGYYSLPHDLRCSVLLDQLLLTHISYNFPDAVCSLD